MVSWGDGRCHKVLCWALDRRDNRNVSSQLPPFPFPQFKSTSRILLKQNLINAIKVVNLILDCNQTAGTLRFCNVASTLPRRHVPAGHRHLIFVPTQQAHNAVETSYQRRCTMTLHKRHVPAGKIAQEALLEI